MPCPAEEQSMIEISENPNPDKSASSSSSYNIPSLLPDGFVDSDDNEDLENQVFVENLVDDMVGRLNIDSPGSNKLLLP